MSNIYHFSSNSLPTEETAIKNAVLRIISLLTKETTVQKDSYRPKNQT